MQTTTFTLKSGKEAANVWDWAASSFFLTAGEPQGPLPGLSKIICSRFCLYITCYDVFQLAVMYSKSTFSLDCPALFTCMFIGQLTSNDGLFYFSDGYCQPFLISLSFQMKACLAWSGVCCTSWTALYSKPLPHSTWSCCRCPPEWSSGSWLSVSLWPSQLRAYCCMDRTMTWTW